MMNIQNFITLLTMKGKELPISLPYLEENTNANNNEIKTTSL